MGHTTVTSDNPLVATFMVNETGEMINELEHLWEAQQKDLSYKF